MAYGNQRSGFVSRSSYGGFSYFPPVIRALLILNIGIFLAQNLLNIFTIGGESIGDQIEYYGALHAFGSNAFYIWQPITYMFLHGGLAHVGMNMLGLWMFGIELENTWGSKKFLTFYILCGLGGAAAHLLLSGVVSGQHAAMLVGASGAIFGLLAAFGLMFPDRLILLYFLIPIKAKYFVGLFLILEFYSMGSVDNIGHLAHLGGALVGIVYMIATSGGSAIATRLRGDGSKTTGSMPNPRNAWRDAPRPKEGGFFSRPNRDAGDEAVDAEFHDVPGGRSSAGSGTATSMEVKRGRAITQEEIDRILDKIAATGYQNLSSEEREILFEAARKMDEKR